MEKTLITVTESEALTNRILATVRAEKIICFGLRTVRRSMWNAFSPASLPTSVRYCDLLVVVADDEPRKRHEITDAISSLSVANWQIDTVLVHDAKSVNRAISRGHSFFWRAVARGVYLYDSGKFTLQRGTVVNYPERRGEVWSNAELLADQFLRAAADAAARGSNNLALFMLHQATEQTCLGLVQTVTGYRPATHHVGRLIRMTFSFSDEIVAIFPCNTREELRLVETLTSAYLGVRYSPGFHVPAEKLSILAERITKLKSAARRIIETNQKNSTLEKPASEMEEPAMYRWPVSKNRIDSTCFSVAAALS